MAARKRIGRRTQSFSPSFLLSLLVFLSYTHSKAPGCKLKRSSETYICTDTTLHITKTQMNMISNPVEQTYSYTFTHTHTSNYQSYGCERCLTTVLKYSLSNSVKHDKSHDWRVIITHRKEQNPPTRLLMLYSPFPNRDYENDISMYKRMNNLPVRNCCCC